MRGATRARMMAVLVDLIAQAKAAHQGTALLEAVLRTYRNEGLRRDVRAAKSNRKSA